MCAAYLVIIDGVYQWDVHSVSVFCVDMCNVCVHASASLPSPCVVRHTACHFICAYQLHMFFAQNVLWLLNMIIQFITITINLSFLTFRKLFSVFSIAKSFNVRLSPCVRIHSECVCWYRSVTLLVLPQGAVNTVKRLVLLPAGATPHLMPSIHYSNCLFC